LPVNSGGQLFEQYRAQAAVPRSALTGRFWLAERTFAGRHGNDANAPKAVDLPPSDQGPKR
jgi:hypothetical protein